MEGGVACLSLLAPHTSLAHHHRHHRHHGQPYRLLHQMTMHIYVCAWRDCRLTSIRYSILLPGVARPPYVTARIHHAPIRPLDALLPHNFSQNSSPSSFSPKSQTNFCKWGSEENKHFIFGTHLNLFHF